MHLSDAIEIGSRTVMPSPGEFYDARGGQPRGCALGMAWYAAGCITEYGVGTLTKDPFPWVSTRNVPLPCGCRRGGTVGMNAAIAHLFDNHVYEEGDWTLAQLIAWVRSVEPAEEEIPTMEAKEEEAVEQEENPVDATELVEA